MEKMDENNRVEIISKCPKCSSKNLVTDYKHAELFCADCGLVVAENIVDLGPEWRAFDSEQVSRRVRTGPPMTYWIHDKGLSTAPPRFKQGKPRRWQTSAPTGTEKTLAFALGEINRMGSALKLPIGIREAASLLYRKAMKKRLLRGRSIESIATVILYITCRQYGVPRTLKEVGAISRVGRKEISRAYRFLSRELDLKVPPASPVDFVPRFCSLLNLSSETKSKAIMIIKQATEKGLADGKGPIGTAAAAIYVAAILEGEHRTQKEVADVTGVTVPTIRNRYKRITEGLSVET